MSRLLLTCLLLGVSSLVAAAETKSPPSGVPFVAKLRYEHCEDGRTMTIVTEVSGTKSTPLKHDVVGPEGTVLRLEFQDIAGTRPTQYVAKFRLTRMKDGKTHVLSEPIVATMAGRPVEFGVGEKGKYWTGFDLLIGEGSALKAEAPKPAAQNSTNKELPRVPASPEGTTSLMKMVPPRIIIQEEEEDKMGVTP